MMVICPRRAISQNLKRPVGCATNWRADRGLFMLTAASLSVTPHSAAKDRRVLSVARPMDRAMNDVRQKNLAAIDPEAEAA